MPRRSSPPPPPPPLSAAPSEHNVNAGPEALTAAAAGTDVFDLLFGADAGRDRSETAITESLPPPPKQGPPPPSPAAAGVAAFNKQSMSSFFADVMPNK